MFGHGVKFNSNLYKQFKIELINKPSNIPYKGNKICFIQKYDLHLL